MAEIHDTPLEAAGFHFRVRVYPAAVPNGSALVWLHGGAFMFGTLQMPEADQVGRRLSELGITVISVDYTLAPLDALGALAPAEPDANMPSPEQMRAEAEAAGPRARFPVASLQIVAAFDWVVSSAAQLGVDPERVGLGGASAGGNLAAGAALRLRDRAQRDPEATVPRVLALIYPVLHNPLPPAGDDLERLLEGLPPFLTFPPASTTAINANYLGDTEDADGYGFPGGRDLRALPSTVIINADRDRLRASGEAFAAELALAGVDVQVIRELGAVHGFLNEIGDAAAERTLAVIARAVGG